MDDKLSGGVLSVVVEDVVVSHGDQHEQSLLESVELHRQ